MTLSETIAEMSRKPGVEAVGDSKDIQFNDEDQASAVETSVAPSGSHEGSCHHPVSSSTVSNFFNQNQSRGEVMTPPARKRDAALEEASQKVCTDVLEATSNEAFFEQFNLEQFNAGRRHGFSRESIEQHQHSLRRRRVEEPPSEIGDAASYLASRSEMMQLKELAQKNASGPSRRHSSPSGWDSHGLLEDVMDNERTAKRAYNRVCAAKSRDKRRRTLSGLHAKVKVAALLFHDLLEKNKLLRENVETIFNETIHGIMGISPEGLEKRRSSNGDSRSLEQR